MKSIAEVMCSDLFGSADYVLIIYSIVRKPDPVIKLMNCFTIVDYLFLWLSSIKITTA